MKKKAVIFDVDNTLLSQSRRLLKAYNNMHGTNHTLEALKKEDRSILELPVFLLREMDPDHLKLFYEDFLTTNYYDKKDSYNLDVVDGSKEFLTFLEQKDVAIIYMSARINCPTVNHTEITDEMLDYFELPRDENTEVHLLESDHVPNNSADFHVLADKFKAARSKELLEKYDIIAGLGDAKSDISAFNSAGILSIQARAVIPELLYTDNAKLHFKSWDELYDFEVFKGL